MPNFHGRGFGINLSVGLDNSKAHRNSALPRYRFATTKYDEGTDGLIDGHVFNGIEINRFGGRSPFFRELYT